MRRFFYFKQFFYEYLRDMMLYTQLYKSNESHIYTITLVKKDMNINFGKWDGVN